MADSNILMSQGDIASDGRDSDALNFQLPIPEVMGQFSLNNERRFVADSSQMKTIKLPSSLNQLHFDLNDGYESFAAKSEQPEYLNTRTQNLLNWIQSPSNSALENVDFICCRGFLTKLMSTPYLNQETWCIVAVKWKGAIYICEYETEEEKQAKLKENEEQKKMRFWGHRFEHYLTDKGDSSSETVPNSGNNPSAVINLNEEFVQVVRTQLDGHGLLFGGEVDGMLDGQLVELKTNRIMEKSKTKNAKKQRSSFYRYKLLKWWAQSFLLGINQIVAGFRDDHGIVKNIQLYDVSELPSDARKACGNCWNEKCCFNFCSRFLTEVKQIVSGIADREPVVLHRTVDGIRWEKSQDPSHHFLPEWYLSSTSTI